MCLFQELQKEEPCAQAPRALELGQEPELQAQDFHAAVVEGGCLCAKYGAGEIL